MVNMDLPRRIPAVQLPVFITNCRTYFVSFCFLIQLQMLVDIPTTMSLSEVNLTLPSSEEEWSANSSKEWNLFHTSPTSPPTPTFKEAFEQLFVDNNVEGIHRYSEFGGYVIISGILSSILNAYQLRMISAITINWKKFDGALDSWQRSWNADPKSHSTGSNNPLGVMAFNASAIYRATRSRCVKDYSKYVLLSCFGC
jgi:hypothetical protein